MAKNEQSNPRREDLVASPRDILFECPACGKSLLVDESAEGLIVECPQCHISVIVPPRVALIAPPPSPAVAPVAAPAPVKPEANESTALQQRLNILAGQLKESQTQWTEVTNRIASRINEVNRDLIVMARLETSHKQILAEWNKIVGEISSASQNLAESPKKS